MDRNNFDDFGQFYFLYLPIRKQTKSISHSWQYGGSSTDRKLLTMIGFTRE